MKILSWKCKGISPPTAICGLRALIIANSLDVLFLFETKISPSLVSPILNHLAFYLMTHVAHSGTCGGLVLAWRLGVELESFVSNKNNICIWGYSNPPNSPEILSYIYGPSKKKTIWPSRTLSLLLVRLLLGLGSAYGISTLSWTNQKNLEAVMLLAPPTVLLETSLIIVIWLT